MSKLIYLNGTSSSGKSTIANSIAEINPSIGVVSADEFGEAFEKTIDKTNPHYSKINILYQQIGDKISNCNNPDNRRCLFKQYYNLLNTLPLPKEFNSDLWMYEHIKHLMQTKEAIVVDDLISTPYLYKSFKDIFYNEKIYMIKIYCELEELRRRELQRGDRLQGMAEFWQDNVNFIDNYDLIINSTKSNPHLLAGQILDFIKV